MTLRAAEAVSGARPQWSLENCRPATDAFEVILDVSGSMMKPRDEREKAREDASAASQAAAASATAAAPDGAREVYQTPDPSGASGAADKDDEKKITEAKRFLVKLAAEADLSIGSGFYTAGPFTIQLPTEVRDAEALTEKIEAIPENLETRGRMTWMGERARKHLTDPEQNAASRAVILVTDGAFTKWRQDERQDPAEVFAGFRAAHPGNSVYLVTATRDPETLQEVETVTGAKARDLTDLLENPESWNAFMREVFASDCTPVVIEIPGIVFDFDKDTLTAESREILAGVLVTLGTFPADTAIEIRGWTDWCGSDEYNAGLSQRRADRVRNWFIENGIESSRLTATGHGKSFTYDNSTSHGRHRNRKVELVIGGIESVPWGTEAEKQAERERMKARAAEASIEIVPEE
ncbi:OmpA family protein [Sutterella sp.]|uniref:OmpA family protein n=1 Tax=Sutterella sp. TaxID=1981025 RepID=UPI0026DF7CD5|nr:OmpA family protein [Sutterella sp.]MDO5532255.1 OmpA family protein [Sutterella sp.]